MASLTKQKAGGWLLQFTGADRKRRSIRIPRCARKTAEGFRTRIETILSCRIAGEPLDRDTAMWLRRLPNDMHGRLARVGLTEARTVATLGAFLKSYADMRTDVSDATRVITRVASNKLIEFFGVDTPLGTISEGDAVRWRLWLLEGRKENTVRKLVRNAKTVFRYAVKQKLVPSNPFAELKGTTIRTRDRHVFVERETIAQVLDEVKDTSDRLMIALGRYAGLRIPSELVGLKWSEVNWERGTLVVHAPKTARCGKGTRVVPIFPELRVFFDAAWDAAPKGVDRIFPEIRPDDRGPRVWLEQMALRAGVVPWPKPWQNLRATRATELANEFPSHVCSDWLGHSEAIADANYRMTTDQHLEAATTRPTGALQKAQRSGTVRGGMEGQTAKKPSGFVAPCPPMPLGVGDAGGREGPACFPRG